MFFLQSNAKPAFVEDFKFDLVVGSNFIAQLLLLFDGDRAAANKHNPLYGVTVSQDFFDVTSELDLPFDLHAELKCDAGTARP